MNREQESTSGQRPRTMSRSKDEIIRVGGLVPTSRDTCLSPFFLPQALPLHKLLLSHYISHFLLSPARLPTCTVAQLPFPWETAGKPTCIDSDWLSTAHC